MKRVCALIVVFWCLLLFGCSQPSEKLPAEYLSRWEGKGIHWKVSAEISYSSESTEKYFKVTFVCDAPEHVYDENNRVFFAIGTSVDTKIINYDKTEGLIGPDGVHGNDLLGVERVSPVSDTKFEVFYEKDLIDIGKEEKEQVINVQLPGESIDLRYAGS